MLYFFLLSWLWPTPINPPATSPLAEYSTQWNEAKYLACNTAANTAYLSDDEKKTIYILNLMRADPALFANTVVQKYASQTNQKYLEDYPEYKSLVDTLRKLKPLPLLYPDSLAFVSARCHAFSSGEIAYVGHERKTEECRKNRHYDGECCEYGHKDPLDIIMFLLIDHYDPNLGHRFIFLTPYKKIAVSIQPHKKYRVNTVIDFGF
jgi:hypothetical protein